MITVALLGLLVLHLKARPIAAAGALLFGALSKETALALGPLFVVAMEGMRETHALERKTRLKMLCAEGVALGIAIVLRFFFAPKWRATFPAFSASEAIETRLAALSKSVVTMVGASPFDRTVCDAFSVTPLLSLGALTGALVGFGIGYLAWARRGPALLLVLALLPSLQVVPIMRWWSPHYTYAPLAFAAMIAGEWLAKTERNLLWTSFAFVFFTVQSLADGARFRSDETLWGVEVARHPQCREAQFYLGEVAREWAQWDRAADHYARAISETPGVISFVDLQAALENFGAVELQRRRPRRARALFEAALEHTSDPNERRLDL